MNKILTLTLACAALVTPAFAASPWDGTWKLDTSKSHLAGASWSYSKTASGKWHFSDGGAYQFDFAPDGSSVPLPTAGDSQIATLQGDHVLIYTIKHNDKVLSTTHEELSADGKTLTDHTTGTREDGTTFDDTYVNTRVAGGPGMLGTWKSSKVSTTPSSGIVLATAPGDILSWQIPSSKMSIKGKMDGSDLAIAGPNASDNIKMSIKKVSATKLDYMVKMSGKPLSEGNLTLSADGKWLTDTNWTPGKEADKTISVYAKQ